MIEAIFRFMVRQTGILGCEKDADGVTPCDFGGINRST